MPVTLKVDGLERAIRSLRGAEPDNDLLRIALKRVGVFLEGVSAIAFRKRQDPRTGRGWKPLHPVTISLRREKSDVPLSDTGRLKNSVSSSTHADKVREISTRGRNALRLVFGTSVEYAATHQFGRDQHPRSPFRGRIPARPFIGVADRHRREIGNIIARAVEQRARRS